MYPQILELTPVALNLSLKDLKAADNTEYPSGFLDLSDYRMFLASIIVAKTGAPGAGAAKLSIDLYDADKVTVLGRIDLLTAISTVAARQELVVWGRGLTPAKQGNGTIGAGIGVAKLLRWCKLILVVSTQGDGTTQTGSVTLLCGN